MSQRAASLAATAILWCGLFLFASGMSAASMALSILWPLDGVPEAVLLTFVVLPACGGAVALSAWWSRGQRLAGASSILENPFKE